MGLSPQQRAASLPVRAWVLGTAAPIQGGDGASHDMSGAAAQAPCEILTQRLSHFEGLVAPSRLSAAVLQLLLPTELTSKDAALRGVAAIALSGPYLPSHLELMTAAAAANRKLRAEHRLGDGGLTTIFTYHENPPPPATPPPPPRRKPKPKGWKKAELAGAPLVAQHPPPEPPPPPPPTGLEEALRRLFGDPLPPGALEAGAAAEAALGLRVYSGARSKIAWSVVLDRMRSKRPWRDVAAVRLEGFLSLADARALRAMAEERGLRTAVVPERLLDEWVAAAAGSRAAVTAGGVGSAAAEGRRRQGRPSKATSDGSASGPGIGAPAAGGAGGGGGGEGDDISWGDGEASGVLVICRKEVDPLEMPLLPDDVAGHPGFESKVSSTYQEHGDKETERGDGPAGGRPPPRLPGIVYPGYEPPKLPRRRLFEPPDDEGGRV